VARIVLRIDAAVVTGDSRCSAAAGRHDPDVRSSGVGHARARDGIADVTVEATTVCVASLAFEAGGQIALAAHHADERNQNTERNEAADDVQQGSRKHLQPINTGSVGPPDYYELGSLRATTNASVFRISPASWNETWLDGVPARFALGKARGLLESVPVRPHRW